MKSRITIEVDFDNSNQPVIQILWHHNSDDVRDKLLSNFIQSLGAQSSWCKINFVNYNEVTQANTIHITPLKNTDLKEHAKLMKLVADEVK